MSDLPFRSEFQTDIRDQKFGKVRLEIYDRLSIDDITLHLIRRELYRLVGGPDSGADVNPVFIDFLVREGFLVR